MSTLETVVASLRAAHVAALISLVGTVVFLTLVTPAAMSECTIEAGILRPRLLHLAQLSARVRADLRRRLVGGGKRGHRGRR